MKQNILIDLKQIVGHKYYQRRNDWRIDLQAGSFIGFLIEKYSLTQLKILYQNYKAPTPDEPILAINSLLTNTFGYDLDVLEEKWKEFLENEITTHLEAEQRAISFTPIALLPTKRCAFCYSAVETADIACKSCKAPTNIKVIVK